MVQLDTLVMSTVRWDRVVHGSNGWIRMAYLNMSNPTEECPSGFRLYSQNGVSVRACDRPVTSGGSCLSVTSPTLRSVDETVPSCSYW